MIAFAQHWQPWQLFIDTCDQMLSADSKTLGPTWLRMVHRVWLVPRGVHAPLTGNPFLSNSLFLYRERPREGMGSGMWDLGPETFLADWSVFAAVPVFLFCLAVFSSICGWSLFPSCWRLFGWVDVFFLGWPTSLLARPES